MLHPSSQWSGRQGSGRCVIKKTNLLYVTTYIPYVMDEKVIQLQAKLFSGVLNSFKRDPEGSKEDLTRILEVYLNLVGKMQRQRSHRNLNNTDDFIHREAVQKVRFPYSIK